MSPFTQLVASLVLALVMWSPAMLSALRGSLSLATASLYLVGALVLSHIGMSLFASIVNNYAEQQRQALERARKVQREIELIEAQKRSDEQSRQRRATDA